MMKRIRRALKDIRNEKGFTLIEMAIVLIIIGVILGAVVKGKDLVKSAEQKRIYTKFVNSWNLAYLGFYDRTGLVLGDFYDTAGTAAGQDGHADTDTDGDGTLEPGDLVTSTSTDFYDIGDIGIEAPTTNSDHAYQYRYLDSDGTGHDMDIAFEYDTTAGFNYMSITNMPGELGIALDTMIDGEADGLTGDFLAFDSTDTTGAAWDTANDNTVHWRMQF